MKLTGGEEELKIIIGKVKSAGNSFHDILEAMRPVLTWKVKEEFEKGAESSRKDV